MRPFHSLILTAFLVLFGHLAHAQTFTVTSRSCNPADAGSLGWAVKQANTAPGADLIVVTVSNSITVYSPLQITEAVEVEGRGATVGAYNHNCDVFQLRSGSDGCILSGLAIVDGQSGVSISSRGNQVRNCRVGTDWADTAGRGNWYGFMIYGGNNHIGGSINTERNIISGNLYAGVYVSFGYGNRIQGNYIGLASDGTTPLSNQNGVTLYSGTGNLVGGTLGGGGNIISGQSEGTGVSIHYGSGNTICGNVMGLAADQVTARGNRMGIRLSQASRNAIGLAGAGGGNLICDSRDRAIYIAADGEACEGNTIQNNQIGINGLGNKCPNYTGINLYDATGTLIGGNRAGTWPEGNIIAGNAGLGSGGEGIMISGGYGNSICGNYIGTDRNGASAIGNSYTGISVSGGWAMIGGPNTDANHQYGNVVSGQGFNGNQIGILVNSAPGTCIQGNLVGLKPDGAAALPNYYGIIVYGSRVLIGGVDPSLRNVIAGNTMSGMEVYGSDHVVAGNYVGTNAAGTALIGNGQDGIVVRCSYSRIGGGTARERNIICGLANRTGIDFQDGSGNTVVGNWINVLANGALSTAVLNCGVAFNHGNGNFIGMPTTHAGNLIAGTDTGIRVSQATIYSEGFFGNTICGFATAGISLGSGGNGNKTAPAITSGDACLFQGTSAPLDRIEVFLADKAVGEYGGSLRLVGTAVADGSGDWSLVPSGPVAGDRVTALGTDASNNTSTFAANVPVSGSTPTPTHTPTVTPTATVTLTRTVTPTPHQSLPLGFHGELQAYPNPAKDQMTFIMNLAQDGLVEVVIYNLVGERIGELREQFRAGQGRALVWDCRNVSPGIYIARVVCPGKTKQTIKVAITR